MQEDVDEPETGLGTLEDEESEPDWQAEQPDAPGAVRSSVAHSWVIYTLSYPAAQEVAGKETKMKVSVGARARVMITHSSATCRGNRRYRRCLAR